MWKKGRCQEPLADFQLGKGNKMVPIPETGVIDNKARRPCLHPQPSPSSSCQQWPGLCAQHQTQATQLSTSPFLLTIFTGLNVHK